MEEAHQPHVLQLKERKNLTMSGVTEVVSFDETAVVVRTALGTLVVQGENLQLKALMPEGGNVTVEGEIGSLQYEQNRISGGWLSRLIR